MAIQSFRCHDNFFHLCLDKGDIIDIHGNINVKIVITVVATLVIILPHFRINLLMFESFGILFNTKFTIIAIIIITTIPAIRAIVSFNIYITTFLFYYTLTIVSYHFKTIYSTSLPEINLFDVNCKAYS